MPPAELNLIGQNELAVVDRWTLERRSRALSQPVYLGEGLALCRVLGRYKMYVDTADIGFGAHVLLDGYWESWLTVFMARRLREGMVTADVGANHGYYTLLFADMIGPGGRVAAVEPNPWLCPLLHRSVGVNGFSDRVTVFEQAASAATAGTAILHVPEGEPKNAHLLVPPISGENDRTVSVRSAPLAESLAGWPPLDIVKIDVEGAEEAAIAGLFPALERDRPDIVLEFNPRRCADPGELLDRLTAIYPQLKFVDFDCEAHPADRAALLEGRRDDWLLYLSVRE